MRALWTVIGLYTIIWGFWLINPWWNVFNSAPLYSELDRFMSEWLWGLNAILAGTIMLAGAWLNSWKALAWGCGAGIYHWGTISALYFAGDWHNTGGITSLFIATAIVITWKVSRYCNQLEHGLEYYDVDEKEIICDRAERPEQPIHLPPAEG
jgi:hypothetical protein